MITKKEIFNGYFGNYNYQFAVVRFLVDSKTDSNRKECMNPISLRVRELLSRDRLYQIQRLSHYHCRSPHHHNPLQVPERPLPLLPIIISLSFFRLHALHNYVSKIRVKSLVNKLKKTIFTLK